MVRIYGIMVNNTRICSNNRLAEGLLPAGRVEVIAFTHVSCFGQVSCVSQWRAKASEAGRYLEVEK